MISLTWDSQFDNWSTFGIISTRMCEELLKLGVDVRLKPWSESTYFSPALQAIRSKPLAGLKVRLSGLSSVSSRDDYSFVPDFVPHFISRRFEERLNYARQARHLIVPSMFTKAGYAIMGIESSIVPRGSDVIPLKISSHPFYTFLFIGYLTRHKGINFLGQAFEKAFKGVQDVRLILKGNSTKTHPKQYDLKLLNKYFPTTFSRVELIRENWSCDKLKELYVRSDCLVSPHRTLGMFGTRVALDARKAGLALVATGLGEPNLWGDKRYLVNYHINPNGIEPDIDELAEAMFECYKKKVTSMPLKGWGWDNSAKMFLRIIEKHKNFKAIMPIRN